MNLLQRCALSLLAGAACAPMPAPQRATPGPATAAMIVAEADRIAARELWPGFDPRRIPVAIYDGERTLLFRHPSPPADFVPDPALPGVSVFSGRHSAVIGNSSENIGGVLTATLVPSSEPISLRARAAVLIHEAFHVHQRARQPGWAANEVELFTYPVDDVDLLALRRLESEALRVAVEARSDADAACWAATGLALRGERFASLAPGAVAYERMSELNEGLAEYVERLASGTDEELLPDTEFAADAVRARAYRTGAALAFLLDRFSPGWQRTLVENDSLTLDAMLLDALGRRPAAQQCAFEAEDRARVRAAAESDIRALHARRAAQRQALFRQSGWTLVIDASDAVLFPQAFDPLNVTVVGTGEVLHSRFLRLGNAAGTVEVLGRAALSQAAGAHPLFNGVSRLTIAGLPTHPALTVDGGRVSLEAEGVRLTLRGNVAQTGQVIAVRITEANR